MKLSLTIKVSYFMCTQTLHWPSDMSNIKQSLKVSSLKFHKLWKGRKLQTTIFTMCERSFVVFFILGKKPLRLFRMIH